MIEQSLQEIGLTPNESKIYLELLKQPESSAYELGQKTALYFQVIYSSLRKLEEKGFVSSFKKGKVKVFRASDPSIVEQFVKDKLQRFQNIMPDLSNLSSQKDDLRVETYQGSKITKIAMNDILVQLKTTGGEVLCSSIDESLWFPKHKVLFETYEAAIARHNITERVIINKGKKGVFKRGSTFYRSIPSKYFNPNPFQVYGDNVQIILWGHQDHLIIIRSKTVAMSYRKQFELMWSIAS